MKVYPSRVNRRGTDHTMRLRLGAPAGWLVLLVTLVLLPGCQPISAPPVATESAPASLAASVEATSASTAGTAGNGSADLPAETTTVTVIGGSGLRFLQFYSPL